MKKSIFIFAFFALTILICFGLSNCTKCSVDKTPYNSFYLCYNGYLLSSSIETLPRIIVNGTKLTYILEKVILDSCIENENDTICIKTLSFLSIDSIIKLVKDINETEIILHNRYGKSAWIHKLSLAFEKDTINYCMFNAFDDTALEIIEIINPYLPTDKRILPLEEYYKAHENYWNKIIEENNNKTTLNK